MYARAFVCVCACLQLPACLFIFFLACHFWLFPSKTTVSICVRGPQVGVKVLNEFTLPVTVRVQRTESRASPPTAPCYLPSTHCSPSVLSPTSEQPTCRHFALAASKVFYRRQVENLLASSCGHAILKRNKLTKSKNIACTFQAEHSSLALASLYKSLYIPRAD